MYQGFGKGDGGITGEGDDDDEGVDFADVGESASAEESLMCRGINDSGEEANLMVSARLCARTGGVIWVREQSEQAIMQRTVGMSQMTSMLHDTDRNDVYERALQLSIKHFEQIHKRQPVVLDIGTGTGLLAMFAARHNAEFVLGCEMFETMAAIAEEVVNDNNFSSVINIIPAKSTSIDSLSPIRPDILVTELLDSALLGESCMYTHADAIKRFMDPGNDASHQSQSEYSVLSPLSQRVMPHSAEIFATLVESEDIEKMHDLSGIQIHGFTPFRDETAEHCPGGWSLVPVQWPELESRGGRVLSNAKKTLNFEFFHTFPEKNDKQYEECGDGGDGGEIKMTVDKDEDKEEEEEENEPYAFGEGCSITDIPVHANGTVHAVMLYWKAFLLSPEIDPERTVTYTTQPGVMNWQDHWLQVVFPLPDSIECSVGDVIRVTSAHSSLRIWMKAEKLNDYENSSKSVKTENTMNINSEHKGIVINDEIDGNNKIYTKKAKITSATATASPVSPVLPVLNLLKDMEGISEKHRLIPSQCSCGWHLLCGVERIQSLNDVSKNTMWEKAIADLLRILVVTQASDATEVSDVDLSEEAQGNNDNNDDNDYNNNSKDNKDNSGSTGKITGPLRVLLDVSDGSVLSIAAAREVKRLQMKSKSKNNIQESGSSIIDNLKVVSIENKIFSRMHHDRLVDANDVSDIMMVWDGGDWGEITSYFADENSDDEGESEEIVEEEVNEEAKEEVKEEEERMTVEANEDTKGDDDEDDEEEGNVAPALITLTTASLPSSSSPPVLITALISECFYYQLHALPTWQALSFLYKRTELEPLFDRGSLVLPGGALIMAAAVELTDLSGTYGEAGIVSGFDHSALDNKQENWHEHMFPYKLGGYRKKLLTKPIVIASLDYSMCAEDIDDVLTSTFITADGRVDCVAVWVDYDLAPRGVNTASWGQNRDQKGGQKGGDNGVSYSSGNSSNSSSNSSSRPMTDDCREDSKNILNSNNILHQWNEEKQDFPCHLKVNLKFFPSPVAVLRGSVLNARTSFCVGDSDFKYDFKLE